MSANAHDNNNSGNGTAEDAIPVAQRLHSIRERIATKLGRPHLAPPQLDQPSLDPLRNSQLLAAHLAGAIGTVNPRPPGLVNDLFQSGKRFLARLLGWLLRPQRDFNVALVESLARTSEALDAMNRNLLALRESLAHSGETHRELGGELDSLWERLERQIGEAQSFLAGRLDRLKLELDSQGGQFEEKMKLQKWALDGVLARHSTTLQERLDLELKQHREQSEEQTKMLKSAYDAALERHSTEIYDQTGSWVKKLQEEFWKGNQALQEEMRVIRQRMAAQARVESAPIAAPSPAGAQAATSALPGIDYFQLERHFRGTEEEIRARQSFYLPFFQGRQNVLDIACGRGEFLDLMREASVNARGVDLDADMVGRCLEKKLAVTRADVFAFLGKVPNGSLDGIFCSQFVEHLAPEICVRLLAECGRTLAPDGVLAIETQNPECLAIFSQSFYLDPTHVKPIPPALLRVLFQEAGLDRIGTHFLSPVSPSLPIIPQLSTQSIEPEALQIWNSAVARFNETFFGGMDYAVIGYRAGS